MFDVESVKVLHYRQVILDGDNTILQKFQNRNTYICVRALQGVLDVLHILYSIVMSGEW